MANASILAAFERMWQHVTTALSNKANSSHSHDDIYYTETEVDALLASKSDTSHNHDSTYDKKGTADTAISTHNTSTSAHNDIRVLINDLNTKVSNFLDVDDTTTDQLSEVITLINNNKGTLESLTTSKINVSDIVDNLTTSSTSKVLSAKQGVAIKELIDALQTELDSHTHAIADVSGLQTALDGKAASNHGTHVSYSTTAPVMDGTASVGTASTVARSDHKHPTDTSRAAQTDLDALETVVAGKANASHSHAISDVTNLQTTLDGKAASSHTHDDRYYTETEVNNLLANKSDTTHTHTKADIGLGNVENKSSATIRGELTKANVTDALGYTPPMTDTTYTAITDEEIDEICSATMTSYLNSIAAEGVSF